MQVCAISSCENSIVGAENTSFKSFPLGNTNLLKKWVYSMKLSEVNPPLSFYICENHFSGSCFDEVKGGIKDDAIPTLKPALDEYDGGQPNDSIEKKKSFVEEQIGSYMCRVCSVKLDGTDNMIFIFDESKRVFEKMKSCLPVIVEDGNDLPHHICEKCFKQLERMYIIRSLAICTESLYFHYLTSISTKENDHTVTGTATIEPEKNKYWVEEQLPLKGPVTCNLCNTEFIDMEQFDLHTEEHVAGSSEEPPGTTLHVACSSCGLIFEADSTYKEHKRSQKYECVACDVILYSYCEMKSHECIPYHVEDEEEEDKPFENDLIKNSPKRRKYYCSPCNRQFQRQVNWVKHKIKHERDELFFECKECDLQFHTVRLLSQHREKCHKNSQNWICRYCGKHTTTKLSLNIHERIHTGVKPFICEWCGNAFRSKANLSQHHAKHTGIRRHSCNVCGKKFSRKSFVTTHMRVHTGERPFACDICEQRFTQVGDMRRHRRRHIVQQHQQQQQSQSTVGGILIQQVILKDEKCDTDSTSIIENSTSTTEGSLQLGSKISIADIRARFL